jgi:hypothetical protein
MRRTFPALCLASTLAFAGSLSAQQPSSNQPARNDGVTTSADFEQTASKSGSTDSVTLTGCLDRATNGTYELRNARMSAPGAAATGTASSAPGSTTSTTARAGTTSSGSTTSVQNASTAGTTGTSGTASAAATTGTTSSATGTTSPTSAARAPMSDMAMTWTLKSSTDLAPHVGHEVQITGRPGAASSSATGNANSATTSNPTTTATGARVESAAEAGHSVEVQAVRMISRSCQ